MNLIHRLTAALAGLSLAAAYPAAAAHSIFLKIPGVTGPVQTAGFQGDIELLDYSQGFSNPSTVGTGAGAGSGAGKVTCGAVDVQKLLDTSSTYFLRAVVTGQHIPSATIYFTERSNDGTLTTPYTVTLTDLIVTSVSQGDTAGRSAGIGVTETVSLQAVKFQFTFSSGATAMQQTVGWDCTTNTAT
jgi:type VI secretion system secreted protein Hcp